MGIKNLHKFLGKHCPHVYKTVHLSEYANKTLAVDVNLYLFQYKKTGQRWLKGLQSFVTMFQRYNIQLIFVYDSKAPVEKTQTHIERKQRKQINKERLVDVAAAYNVYRTTRTVDPILLNVMERRGGRLGLLPRTVEQAIFIDDEVIEAEIHSLKTQLTGVTREDIRMSREMLDMLGVRYYDSPNEAETLCAHLVNLGQADAAVSNDTDVLAYGTALFLTKINVHDDTCTEICIDEIYHSLDITFDQFRDFCIMCGTDYNRNMTRIGNEKAFKLIKKFGNLESIESIGMYDTSILNYTRVRELFSTPKSLDQTYGTQPVRFLQTH